MELDRPVQAIKPFLRLLLHTPHLPLLSLFKLLFLGPFDIRRVLQDRLVIIKHLRDLQ